MRGVTLSWLLAALLTLPLTGKAASGAWQASASGPSLGVRGNWLLSPALKAPSAAAGTISLVNWRYTLSRPAPAGLVVRLCAQSALRGTGRRQRQHARPRQRGSR